MKRLIFFSIENWDDVWRRNQPLCYEFVRLDSTIYVMFIGPPVTLMSYLRHGYFRSRYVLGIRVKLINFIKVVPDRVWLGRYLNQLVYEVQLRFHNANNTSDSIIYAKTEYYAYLISRIPSSKVIYDNGDDWASAQANISSRLAILRNDRWMSTNSDEVICVSQRLCELRSSAGAKNPHLIPNGVFVERYSLVGDTAISEIIKIGYVGTMHPDRFDLDYVLDLASLLPNAVILLAGPFMFPAHVIAKVRSVANITLVGTLRFDDVPEFLMGCQYLIHPHLVSEFTESLQPIKLWEYFATGKEIIATNVAGFRDYSCVVHICATPVEAAEIIEKQSMNVDPIRSNKRIEIARKNSWEVRARQIMELI